MMIPVKYFPNKMVAMVRVFYHCVFGFTTSTIHTHLIMRAIMMMMMFIMTMMMKTIRIIS